MTGVGASMGAHGELTEREMRGKGKMKRGRGLGAREVGVPRGGVPGLHPRCYCSLFACCYCCSREKKHSREEEEKEEREKKKKRKEKKREKKRKNIKFSKLENFRGEK
jgi:hypothetical protein